MKFENSFVSKEDRYLLGVETESQHHFIAIPVSNRMVDYIEAYKISDDEYRTFLADNAAAVEFAESCRRRERDDRLFMHPGSDRGTPR